MSAASSLDEHVAALCEAAQAGERVRVVAGGSKPALSAGANLSLASASGVLEYDPLEYTFTALAATPVRDVQALLAAHGQYLPFDPPLAAAGATLGGTVAAGLSGPGRFRYGGVRDFLLGVRFVSGEGELLTGGAKVVKNAAGFDLPKLLVGSLGRFGVLLEVTFKVFPHPEAYATLVLELPDLGRAADAMRALAGSSLDLACLELEPPRRLLLRVGGSSEALARRLERIEAFVGQGGAALTVGDDAAFWERERELAWAPEADGLVKVALGPGAVEGLEEALAAAGIDAPRRYGVGGNVAYLAWPAGLEERLEPLLAPLALSALALRGPWPKPLLGRRVGDAFARRVADVLDPRGIFAPGGREATRAA